jgi:Cof subfamily protein (haloacid dehalogenase superfamily)
MKLIALDLDGTTFNSKKEISKENIEAIRKAQEQGHVVMVLSGRAIDEIKPDLEKHDLHCPVGANNGSALYVDNNLVNMIVFQPEQINKLALEFEKEHLPYTMSTNKGVYAPKDWDQRLEKVFSAGVVPEEFHQIMDPEMFKNFQKQYGHRYFTQLEEIISNESISIQKFFITTLDPKQKKRVETFLDSIDEIYVASTSLFIDIMHHHASKGNALKYMADYLKIPIEDTVAIGDEINDITMFNVAGLSIAMGNASDAVKEHSDIVTLTNDEHGVAYAINNYVLNK